MDTGTINRGVYEIAMLEDGWNQRLIYTFGGGCAGGWFKQGTGTGGVDDEEMLRQGYAVASNSLNVMGNDCAELTTIEGNLPSLRDQATDVQANLPGQVYETVIPRNVRLSEAPSHGRPAILYDIESKGAQSYLQLASEMLQRHKAASHQRKRA